MRKGTDTVHYAAAITHRLHERVNERRDMLEDLGITGVSRTGIIEEGLRLWIDQVDRLVAKLAEVDEKNKDNS